jgi:AraC-like DNA-binding protein
MVVEICTESVPRDERPDYWRQIRRDLFKDSCQIKPGPDASFQASLSLMKVGPLILSDCRGSSFRMIRQGCDEAGSLALLIQKEGDCVIHRRNQQTLLRPGNFCIFPAGHQAEFEMPGTYRQFSLRFQASLLSERFAGWEHSAFTPIPCDSGAGGIFLGLVGAMQQHGESAHSKCCIEAFQAMLGLLATTLRERAAEESPAQTTRMASYHKARIRSFVLENLANPELDISRIADAVGLSHRYVHRLFSDEPMQLMQWIWSERLERCFKALTSQQCADRPVSAIAYDWGFNDASHFSRSFRKRYGVSPRDIQSGYQRPFPAETHGLKNNTLTC